MFYRIYYYQIYGRSKKLSLIIILNILLYLRKEDIGYTLYSFKTILGVPRETLATYFVFSNLESQKSSILRIISFSCTDLSLNPKRCNVPCTITL